MSEKKRVKSEDDEGELLDSMGLRRGKVKRMSFEELRSTLKRNQLDRTLSWLADAKFRALYAVEEMPSHPEATEAFRHINEGLTSFQFAMKELKLLKGKL
ncbi:MAG TPA: hypothetical protein VGM38_10560 [Pseudolysinimonas sp.]|jgi:hypothetical protein